MRLVRAITIAIGYLALTKWAHLSKSFSKSMNNMWLMSSSETLTVENQDGVVMTINKLAHIDPWEYNPVFGEISYQGQSYALIDEDAGVVTVTFADGIFESF